MHHHNACTVLAATVACFSVYGGDHSLLNYAIAQQEVSRSAISTCEFHLKVQSNGFSEENGIREERHQIDSIQWIQQESWIRVDRAMRERRGDLADDNHFLLAMNGSYAAHWAMNDAGAIIMPLTVSEHEATDRMTEMSSGSTATVTAGVDVMSYAFGTGSWSADGKTLRAAIASADPWESWSAEHEIRDSRKVVVIRCLSERAYVDGPVVEAILDPERGYLTTSLTVRNAHEDGTLDYTYSYAVDIEQVAPGLWFPKTIHMDTRSEDLHSDPRSIFEKHQIMEVRDVQINQPISPDVFRWESLDYTGDEAFLVDINNTPRLMKVVDLQLVPDLRSRNNSDLRHIGRAVDNAESTIADLAQGQNAFPASAETLTAKPIAAVAAQDEMESDLNELKKGWIFGVAGVLGVFALAAASLCVVKWRRASGWQRV